MDVLDHSGEGEGESTDCYSTDQGETAGWVMESQSKMHVGKPPDGPCGMWLSTHWGAWFKTKMECGRTQKMAKKALDSRGGQDLNDQHTWIGGWKPEVQTTREADPQAAGADQASKPSGEKKSFVFIG